MQTFELLADQWTAEGVYESLWGQAKQQVKRWLWTDRPRFDLRPDYFRRQGVSKGRRLDGEPVEKNGVYSYGLDSQNRVQITRFYAGDTETLDTLYTYTESMVEGASYLTTEAADSPVLQHVSRFIWQDGRPLAFELYGPSGRQRNVMGGERLGCIYREQYTYDDDRLSHIRAIELSNRQYVKQVVQESFIYDQVGRLDYIERQVEGEGDAFVVYQRPVQGQTVKALTKIIQQRLVEVVSQVVADLLDPKEPFYCLVLQYNLFGEECLPPSLAFGTADARTMLLHEYQKEVSDYLWDPQEFARYGSPRLAEVSLEGRDDVLDEVCFLLDQQLTFLDARGQIPQLLNQVARELMKVQYEPHDGLTGDFVVYAVDIDFEDFEDNFEASVPPDMVEALIGEGLY